MFNANRLSLSILVTSPLMDILSSVLQASRMQIEQFMKQPELGFSLPCLWKSHASSSGPQFPSCEMRGSMRWSPCPFSPMAQRANQSGKMTGESEK